jgi:hypothetical protein
MMDGADDECVDAAVPRPVMQPDWMRSLDPGPASAKQPGAAPVNTAAASTWSDIRGSVAASKHPQAAAFHLLFKTAAVVFYAFGGLVSDSFIGVFVLVVLLLAFDFWCAARESSPTL